jgi:hypothetical protein
MILPLLLLAVDFMNFNYTATPCTNVPPPIRMSKGSYSYFDEKMGAGFDVFVKHVELGSLSAGTQQAVVVLACDFPAGGTAQAFAFDIHGDTAQFLGPVGSANWGPDWGRGPDSIHISFKNNLLYVDSCKDDECGMRESRTYELRAGKLVKLHAKTYKPTN